MKLSHLLTTMFIFISSNVLAVPTLPKPIDVYTSQDGGVYTTSWTAYPLRVEAWKVVNGKVTNRPDQLTFALFADGKTSSFEGLVKIYCTDTQYSNISASNVDGEQSKSFKKALADDTLPREVVTRLSARACR